MQLLIIWCYQLMVLHLTYKRPTSCEDPPRIIQDSSGSRLHLIRSPPGATMWITTPAGEHASIACIEAQFTWVLRSWGVYAQFTSLSISSIEPHTGPHEREDLKGDQGKCGLLRLIQEHAFLKIATVTSRVFAPCRFSTRRTLSISRGHAGSGDKNLSNTSKRRICPLSVRHAPVPWQVENGPCTRGGVVWKVEEGRCRSGSHRPHCLRRGEKSVVRPTTRQPTPLLPGT